jgi:hypothetical protein
MQGHIICFNLGRVFQIILFEWHWSGFTGGFLHRHLSCTSIRLFKITYVKDTICEHDIITGTDDDLEYYVRECGDILGVMQNLAPESRDAKHIIEYIFTQVVEFKKLNQVNRLYFYMFCRKKKISSKCSHRAMGNMSHTLNKKIQIL